MRRRDFMTLLGGVTVAWPLVAHAQPGKGVRRIGVLMPPAANDPEAQARNVAFEQSLRQLGWTTGKNLQIDYRRPGEVDYRWPGGEAAAIQRYAAELVALAPDVIVTVGRSTIGPVLQASRTIPIVFVNLADPVGIGVVRSLARPEGNATGFTDFEYSMSGKWLELLRQIAPHVTRVAVLRDPAAASGAGQFSVIQSSAPTFGVELVPINVRDAGEIERDIAALERSGNGGLIVTSGGTASHRDLIIELAARHKLPAIYPFPYYAKDGGLIAYGPDPRDLIRRAAAYVDRILKGEKPAQMPVQAPSKYELVINLKTAKAIGLTVPSPLQQLADEIIK